jgi:hypothetical protein
MQCFVDILVGFIVMAFVMRGLVLPCFEHGRSLEKREDF